jgi:N-acetylglucosamine kinase-like BadF-type ATPase
MPSELYLGVDAGGTRTRAAVVDETGAILGEGESGPGNLMSADVAAVRNITEAVRQALGGVPPDAVTAACIAAAGLLSLPESAGPPFGELLRAKSGLDCAVAMRGDVVAAFAAGSPAPDGTVVIAGTGAVAFAIEDHARPARRADGYGWLLGDLGSGFWMGREAVSAVLRHLDGGGPGGWLVQAVIAEIAPADRSSGSVIGRCMAEAPARLARFAPMVCEAADGGDALALDIVERSVEHLTGTTVSVAKPGLPIVLAGGLIERDTPVARGLRARLSAVLPDAPLRPASRPVLGAAWLAARAGGHPDPTALHHRLTNR